MKNKLLICVGLAASILFSACGDTKKNDPNHIKVGVEAGPELVVAQTAQKVAKEKYGLDVELVSFQDYVMPNTALNDGDIDVNAIQHKPFLNDVIKQRGYKLVPVGNTFIYPLAGYSSKIKSLDELKDGSTIVIPNDPTNGGRALLLLQQNKLIELKDPENPAPKITDIVKNPKNLDIKEIEAPQLPRMLEDNKVVISIINNTFAAKAGLDSNKALFIEGKDSPYVNLIVAREDNQNEEKVKKFVQAYQSEEVVKAAEEQFKGNAIKGW